MYLFTEVLCQGIQPQDVGGGACPKHMRDFSKLHVPTCPQQEIQIHLQGEERGMPLFLHVRLSVMVNPSYWWQGIPQLLG